MDNIHKLHNSINRPFVKENKFIGQESKTNKVFFFKMSMAGLDGRVDLVK